MNVVTTTLEMLVAPDGPPRQLPPGARIDVATGISPEYARFLYGLVGGPWNWTDRLEWSHEQWAADIAVPGTEFRVLYGGGVPWGYVQLRPVVQHGCTHVELQYFGLAGQAIGRGLGACLLEHAIAAAWSLPNRAALPPARRIWLHTCTLDGPAALANYRARGFSVTGTSETDELVPAVAPGSWAATGGHAS